MSHPFVQTLKKGYRKFKLKSYVTNKTFYAFVLLEMKGKVGKNCSTLNF